MNKVFGSEDSPLTICCGKIHDYLGMSLDYSLHDKVKNTMIDYIEGFISKIPSSLKDDSVTASPNCFFEIGDVTPILQPTYSNIYYHRVMQILWLANRSHTDLLPAL